MNNPITYHPNNFLYGQDNKTELNKDWLFIQFSFRRWAGYTLGIQMLAMQKGAQDYLHL